MAITLDEALRLLEDKKDRLRELRQLRYDSAVLRYEEGETEEFINRPERTVEDITAEITFLSKQIRKLQLAITKANVEIETEVELEGEKLLLGEVLVAIRQLREEHNNLVNLAKNKNQKTKKREREFVDGQIVYVTKVNVNEVLYNTAKVKEDAEKTKKLIDKMQAVINKINIETEIDFVDEEFAN